MRAWVFQDSKQLAKLGADGCPWSVGWYDPDGKRKSKSIGSRSMAEKFARKVEGQLAAGVYRNDSRKTWAEFLAEYETRIAAAMPLNSRLEVMRSLMHFGQIAKPGKLAAIKTQTIDAFIAERRTHPGRHGGELVVNKELRCIKAALRIANEWGYLPVVPKIRMLKEPKRLPRYVTPEDFAAIYDACDAARFPKGLPYTAAEWWRALLVFAYMTGWRIGECLALRRDDLDLAAGKAITRADDNKGNRDDVVRLHPVVFPWSYHERTLWTEFARIQAAAGIRLPCARDHQHTDACHVYGFHDLRRAFATLNAPALSADALQKLMRHRSYLTTQKYVNMAGQLQSAVESLHVPEVLAKRKA